MPLRAIYKPESPLKRWTRRVLPVLVVVATSAAAFGLTLLLPQASEQPFFVFFLGAIGVSAWLYGITAGAVSVGLNVFVLDYFVLPPAGSLRMNDPSDAIRLAVFAIFSMVIAIVVAKLRQTQEAFKLAHERFELAHEIARIWAWEVDMASSKVTWASSPNVIPGGREDPIQVWLQVIHPDDRDRVTAAMKRAVETKKPYEVEFRVVLPEDEMRWLASCGEFYRAQNGDHRMIGVNLDITLRKQAEETLETAAKGRMAGELAHEINNPLQGLTHALYLLHQQIEQTDAKRYSDIAQSEAQRVSQLVNQILRLYIKPGIPL